MGPFLSHFNFLVQGCKERAGCLANMAVAEISGQEFSIGDCSSFLPSCHLLPGQAWDDQHTGGVGGQNRGHPHLHHLQPPPSLPSVPGQGLKYLFIPGRGPSS